MWRTHISDSAVDLHVRENSVAHSIAEPQIKEMKAKMTLKPAVVNSDS